MENDIGKRIRELAESKDVTFAQMERELGLFNGELGRWRKRIPKIDRASEVADYFNVSLDYLFGREEKETQIKQENNSDKNVSDDMIEVMEKMQGMTKEQQKQVRDIVNVLDRK